MAVTQSNIRRESIGSLWSLTGDFTSADGDSTFTVNHGFYFVASGTADIHSGGIATQRPKITHSAGVATILFDDTLGYSGKFQFTGK